MTKSSDWTIPEADRVAIEAMTPPFDTSFDPTNKDMTYPHCNTWSTGQQCITNGGLDAGVIMEERCIDENGHVTKHHWCEV
jgi:hypothetical protein